MTTPAKTYYLAVESGGSGTRVALADGAGAILCQLRCASGSALYRDPARFADELQTTLRAVLEQQPSSRGAIVAAGLAGPMDVALVADVLHTALPGVPRHQYSEGDIARGLYDLAAGIALIAGTGSSCSAADAQGKVVSIGGYGPQFGDEGSGYWIGREGLKAAFLAEQHRIAPTTLLGAARDFFEVRSPWEIHALADGSGHVPAPRIAAFAPEVARAAGAGDQKARQVLDAAGAHLGRLILDTAAQAHWSPEPIPLVMTGGTLRAHRVVAAIERTLAAEPYAFSHFPIVHEPIEGLIRLLQRQNGARTLNDVS